MATVNGGRLSRVTSDSVYSSNKRRRNSVQAITRGFHLADGYKTVLNSNLASADDSSLKRVLAGKCVFLDPALYDRPRLVELAIQQLGAASIVGSKPIGTPLDLAVASPTTSGVMNATTKAIVVATGGAIDVVKPVWLEDCTEKGYALPLEPQYVLHACESTRAAYSRWVDPWDGNHVREMPPPAFAAYWSRIPEDPRISSLRNSAERAITSASPQTAADAATFASRAASEVLANIASDLPAADSVIALQAVMRPGIFRNQHQSRCGCSSTPRPGLLHQIHGA